MIWKPIVSMPHGADYEVSDNGLVRRSSASRGTRAGKVRRTHIRPKQGYAVVTLGGRKYKRKVFYVHRLVAAAFLPNPQKLPQVNHKDGDRAHNASKNLEWCTSKHNCLHAYRVLKRKPSGPRGAACHLFKFTDAMRAAIREDYANIQMPLAALYAKHHVSATQVRRVVAGCPRRLPRGRGFH